MRAVTIKEAKAHLNELVDAATNGEQVVLMRGSKHVAAIVALSADELELPTRLGDDQAAHFWKLLAEEERRKGTVALDSPGAAAVHLSRLDTGRRAPRRRRR